MAFRWLDNGNLWCEECKKKYSKEGCDGALGCTCDAHSHIEMHEKNDWMKLPKFRNMTPNQLEGRSLDGGW